jgi:hypothetical protein
VRAFDVASGRPVGMLTSQSSAINLDDFECQYVDMKWPAASGKYRKSIAEAMTSVIVAVLPKSGRPGGRQLRSALTNRAFNARQRPSPLPADVADVLEWVAANSPPLGDLSDPEILRSVLDALATKLDGGRAAGTVVNRKRAALQRSLACGRTWPDSLESDRDDSTEGAQALRGDRPAMRSES